MPWPTRIGQIILFCVSAFGFKALFLFSLANGFIDHIQQPHKTGKLLASTPEYEDVPLSPWLSGFSARIDRQNQDFLIFMWPFVDGARPDASLVFLNFAGAAGAAWMLVVIESERRGHKRSVLSCIFPWGYLFFHYSHAIITPLYSIWNLFWSRKTSPHDYLIGRVSTIALILSQVLAYIIPLALFAAPVPRLLTVFQKQTIVAWYQPWSVWIAVTHFLITASRPLWQSGQEFQSNHTVSLKSARSHHRVIYAFVFALAAIPHLIVLSITLSALLYPGLYAQPDIFSLRNVFIPPSPWSGTNALHLADGCKWLLQWDYITGSTGVLVWVLIQYVNFFRVSNGRVSWVGIMCRVLIFGVLTGPTAAAIELLWERDESLFDVIIEEAFLNDAKAVKE